MSIANVAIAVAVEWLVVASTCTSAAVERPCQAAEVEGSGLQHCLAKRAGRDEQSPEWRRELRRASLPDSAFALPASDLVPEEFVRQCVPRLREHVDTPAAAWIGVDGPTHTEGLADFMDRAVEAGAFLLHMAATHEQIGSVPRVNISWPGVDLTAALEPSIFDWTTGATAAGTGAKATPLYLPANLSEIRKRGARVRDIRTPSIRTHHDTRVAPRVPGVPLAHVPGCALGALFRPSVGLSSRVPGFATVLQALRQPDVLSISLYARALPSEVGVSRSQIEQRIESAAAIAASCAMQLERRFGDAFEGGVVWLALSPEPLFRHAIKLRYDGRNRRKVIALETLGQHTAPDKMASGGDGKNPQQAVVEAIADWWLLGEADLVVLQGGGTYGLSAAARRPHTHSVFRLNDGDTVASCGAGDETPIFENEATAMDSRSVLLDDGERLRYLSDKSYKLLIRSLAVAASSLDLVNGTLLPPMTVKAVVEANGATELLARWDDLLAALLALGFVWDTGESGLYGWALPPIA